MSLFNVSLLAPLALLGLAALAVPLYLHMRHKPRAEIFKFPAIDFLLKAQKKRKRRFRVEQWLLMAFRMLIILLLAILFAKPFLDKQDGQSVAMSGQPLVLILDDSISMMAAEGGERLFDRAVEQIGSLLDRRPSGSPTRLLIASAPETLAAAHTSSEIEDQLPGVKVTTYGATLDNAYKKALEIIETERWEQSSIRIFTDGSATAWETLPSAKPEKVDVIYSSLRETPQAFENRSITSVAQAPGDTNSVEVSLFNSNEDSRDLRLEISGSGSSAMKHEMRVEGASFAAHRFGLAEPLPPTLSIRIPDDNFDLDNEVVFAPKPNKSIKVLIVDGDTHPEAIRSESFFFRNALGGDESDRYGFLLDVVTPNGLTRERVSDSDVICLLNVDAPATDFLKEALRDGKGVFIGMGDRMDFERWNLFFSDVSLELYEAQKFEAPMAVDIKSFDHPMFPPIEDLEWTGYLSNVGIQILRLVSVGRSNFEIPMALANGHPLLLSKDLNPGKMMIWSSSMDLDWNNFALEFGYVPFVRQIVSYLAGRDSSATWQRYTTNEARDRELLDKLNLKYSAPVFKNLNVAGPVPGVYTLNGSANRTEFVQITLDPSELDFRTMEDLAETDESTQALEELGFRNYLRSDLAPSIQWLLFLLILVETAVAARISLNWGAR